MNGTELGILIVFIILLLAGLGIGIYFVWKYEKDKNNPQGPTGAPNPNPGPPGPSGPSGASGATGIIPGNFSISPVSDSNFFMSFTPGNGDNPLEVITSSDASRKCSNYSWQNIANFIGPSNSVITVPSALVSNADTNLGNFQKPVNLTNGVNSLKGPAILSNDTTASASTILSWTYNPVKKAWCGTETIYNDFCLYYNPGGNVTVENFSDGGITLQAQNFQWNISNVVTSPNCVP